MSRWIFLPGPPTGFDHHFQSVAGLAVCVPPSLKCQTGGTGMLNLFPITYAFRPRLRGRLTLGGRTFPRNSWDFGGRDSHPACRYSCPHNHFHVVHVRFPLRFNLHGTLLYPSRCSEEHRKAAVSAVDLVPFIFGAKSLD